MERPTPDLQGPLPIMVRLAVDGDTGTPAEPDWDAIRTARTAVLERLREVLSPTEYEAVRTFQSVPAIALSATPEVIAFLLTMAEVVSVERDHELQLQCGAGDSPCGQRTGDGE